MKNILIATLMAATAMSPALAKKGGDRGGGNGGGAKVERQHGGGGGHRAEKRQHRQEQRAERRGGGNRHEFRAERREHRPERRAERREQRKEFRAERREQRPAFREVRLERRGGDDRRGWRKAERKIERKWVKQERKAERKFDRQFARQDRKADRREQRGWLRQETFGHQVAAARHARNAERKAFKDERKFARRMAREAYVPQRYYYEDRVRSYRSYAPRYIPSYAYAGPAAVAAYAPSYAYYAAPAVSYADYSGYNGYDDYGYDGGYAYADPYDASYGYQGNMLDGLFGGDGLGSMLSLFLPVALQQFGLGDAMGLGGLGGGLGGLGGGLGGVGSLAGLAGPQLGLGGGYDDPYAYQAAYADPYADPYAEDYGYEQPAYASAGPEMAIAELIGGGGLGSLLGGSDFLGGLGGLTGLGTGLDPLYPSDGISGYDDYAAYDQDPTSLLAQALLPSVLG